jgi:hypothetical protein
MPFDLRDRTALLVPGRCLIVEILIELLDIFLAEVPFLRDRHAKVPHSILDPSQGIRGIFSFTSISRSIAPVNKHSRTQSMARHQSL